MDKLKTKTEGGVEHCKFNENGKVCGSAFSYEIVDELNRLYRNRLSVENPEERLKTMEEWVKDLLDQNAALVKLAQELENEAIKRVSIVERMKNMSESGGKENEIISLTKRIQCLEDLNASLKDTLSKKDVQIEQTNSTISCLQKQTAEMAKAEHTLKTNESKVNDLNKCIEERGKTITCLNEEIDKLKENIRSKEKELKCSELSKQDSALQMSSMQKEMKSLKERSREKDEIIRRFQAEFDRLNLDNRTKEQHSLRMCEMEKEMNDLKMDLTQHLRTVERLRNQNAELLGLLCKGPPRAPNGSNIAQDKIEPERFTCECGGGDSAILQTKLADENDLRLALTAEIAEKHDTIITLKDTIRTLEEQLKESDMRTHYKDGIIGELRKEVKLGRAKESLAEMLGLKEGPRAQMKDRIDRLHADLDEKESEITRLNGLIETSRLPLLESRIETMTRDLATRDKQILTMCDKIEYVRSYLARLKDDELTSIKCGLESLLIELTDDLEWSREARRNVSVSHDSKDATEHVIIINHRSHSLPDSTLQRQVQNLRGSDSSLPAPHLLHGTNPCAISFEDVTRLKERNLSLEKTKSDVLDVWNSMRKFDIDEYERCTEELDAIVRGLTIDHDSLKCICHNYDRVFEQMNALRLKSCPSEYAFSSVEAVLSTVLQSLKSADCKQQLEVWPVLIQNVESNVTVASNLLEEAKSAARCQKELLSGFEFGKIRESQRTLNKLIANEDNFIQKLTTIKKVQESLSKNVLDKLDVLETKLISHQKEALSMKSEVEAIVEDFERKEKALLATKSFITANTSSSASMASFKKTMNESKIPKELFFQPEKLQSNHSNKSDGQELNKLELAKDIEIKGANLHRMISALCGHVYAISVQLNEVSGKIAQFECSYRLVDLLRITKSELSSALKTISEHSLLPDMLNLNSCLSRAEGEIHRFAEIVSSASETPFKNSSGELNIVPKMQQKVLETLGDFLKSSKVAQRQDNESLKNYSNQIELYKSKIEEMKMKIKKSSLCGVEKVPKEVQTQLEMSDVDESEESKNDVINRLQTELNQIGQDLVHITSRYKNLEEEKRQAEENSQKMSKELQSKVTQLQSQLHSYKEKEENQQQTLNQEFAPRDELLKLNKLNREFRERFENAERELNVEKEEIRKLKELLVFKDQAMANLKKGVHHQENLFELAQKFNELVDSYDDKCKQLAVQEEKVVELGDEILTLRQHLENESKIVVDLLKENKTLKDSINYLQTWCDLESQNSREKCKNAGERVSLVQTITSLKYEKKVLTDNVKYAEKFALDLKNLNDELMKENERLRSENEKVTIEHQRDNSFVERMAMNSGDTARNNQQDMSLALKQRDGTIAYLFEERKNMICLITKLRNLVEVLQRQTKNNKKRRDSLSSTLGTSETLTVTSGEL